MFLDHANGYLLSFMRMPCDPPHMAPWSIDARLRPSRLHHRNSRVET